LQTHQMKKGVGGWRGGGGGEGGGGPRKNQGGTSRTKGIKGKGKGEGRVNKTAVEKVPQAGDTIYKGQRSQKPYREEDPTTG